MTQKTLQAEEAGQDEVIAFLSDPATHGGAAVRQVDTHISRIFLAGNRAWKMKRAIRTNYLDFSTPGLREVSCRREIEVNAAASAIYDGVVPVVRRADGLHLGGDGEPVEWLVRMHRFDRRDELDRMCVDGRLSRELAEDLADTVARLHAQAPETPEFGDAEDLRGRIDQIAGALGATIAGDPAPAADWAAAAQRERQYHGALIAHRHRTGRIRRCHGDLHLGNVVLIDGHPTPFDAIEFSEPIASIDVMYDLALLLADLVMRGRRDLSNAVLNRYLAATRDHAGLALLPLFLSMRGAVRAMAAASRGNAEEARRDLDLAMQALRDRPVARLIAVGGMSGSGKSSVARGIAPGIAPLTGAVIIRSDVTRKRLAGVSPETSLPETAYGDVTHRRVMRRMAVDARASLRAGWPVVMDATFLGDDWRACAARLAACEGVAFDGVWLDLPPEAAIRRVETRGKDASDATAGVVLRQAAVAACPEGWHRVSADAPLAAVVRAAADTLR